MSQSVQSSQPQTLMPWSTTLLRWSGYGLLVLALFDLIDFLIPFNLLDAQWQFQTVGQLVERTPIPLIGLILIFYGENKIRRQWERPTLKILSWLSLIVAVLYVFLIPLAISSYVTLDGQTVQQFETQSNQQISRAEQLRTEIRNSGDQDLAKLDTQSSGEQQPQELRDRLLTQVDEAQKQITSKYQESQASQQLILSKRMIKWSLGAIVASCLFVYVWRLTKWAR